MTSIPIQNLQEHSLIYLATPYTKHPDGREYAYKIAAANLAHLVGLRLRVYSPITHYHTASILDPENRLKHLTPDEWFAINLPMMEICDCLAIPDWKEVDESEGVAKEVSWFAGQKLPVYKLKMHLLRAIKY